MADTGTHTLFGGAVLFSVYTSGYIDLPTAAQSACFFFGTGATDLTGPLYKYGLPQEKRGGPWSSWTQAQFNDAEYARLDKHSWWAMPYIVTHSLLGSILIIGSLWLLTQSELILWFGAGHLTHLVLDEPTHERSYCFWPFPIRIPGRNWYDYQFCKSGFWRTHQWVTGLSVIAYHVVWAIGLT